MHPNAELITRFYTAFQQKDWQGMAACYHPNVVFNDSVFTDLRGKRAGQMWQMLCERGKDLRLEFKDVSADDTTGKAHWDAYYTFSRTGRNVHNSIDASFRFQDGLIIEHRDSFNFWRWSSQALGATGLLLGWTPFLQKKVQAQSMKTLDDYFANRP
jgi:ketosteroid isomerase-like protein